jgi:hypothetical protein
MARYPLMRYSLRAFLLAGALIPVGAYWLALPTLNAQRYMEALNGKKFETADALCLDRQLLFPGNWTKHEHLDLQPGLSPLTWSEFLSGQRRLYVGITYGDGTGLVGCGVECTATRRGIEVGKFMP